MMVAALVFILLGILIKNTENVFPNSYNDHAKRKQKTGY
jgi:hypothetical protein